MLFGKYNPAGRTPVTFYSSTEQLPPSITQSDFYEGHGLTYRYYNESTGGPVLYPFGQCVTPMHALFFAWLFQRSPHPDPPIPFVTLSSACPGP